MDYTRVRKLFLKVFLGFLGLTALIAIVAVLSNEFGDRQIKILTTCFSISAASIASMSCAAYIERTLQKELGLTGIVLAVSSAALIIAGIWMEMEVAEYWKTTFTTIIIAVAFAHSFLLLLPDLDSRHLWVQMATLVSIAVLALMILGIVWVDFSSELYARILSAMAIIVGLETLAVPILRKLRPESAAQSQKLVLEQVDGNVYRNSSGILFEIRQIENGPEEEGDFHRS